MSVHPLCVKKALWVGEQIGREIVKLARGEVEGASVRISNLIDQIRELSRSGCISISDRMHMIENLQKAMKALEEGDYKRAADYLTAAIPVPIEV